jgi:hypothetical protein
MLTAKTKVSCFKCKCDRRKHSQTNLTSVIKGENGNVCEAIYKVSYHIAHCSEAHLTVEDLSIPCMENLQNY